MESKLITFHSVEFIRKGRRLHEREDFRLEVPVEIREISRKDLVDGFKIENIDQVRNHNTTRQQQAQLYGFDGGLWRCQIQDDGNNARDTTEVNRFKNGEMIIDPLVYPALRSAVGERNKVVEPNALPIFPYSDGTIIKDDREARTAIAQQAAARVILVDGDVWIRGQDPVWVVSRAANPKDDLTLAFDIHHDFQSYRLGQSMTFRIDRLAEAEAWAKLLRGAKSVNLGGLGEWTDDQLRVQLAARQVSYLDRRFLSRDDVVEYAKTHLARTVSTCALVLHAMPEKLRRQWEELRIAIDELEGPNAREAAEIGLGQVPGILKLLAEVRDIDDDVRNQLMRGVGKLQQAQRRAELIEHIHPTASTLHEVDLGMLVP